MASRATPTLSRSTLPASIARHVSIRPGGGMCRAFRQPDVEPFALAEEGMVPPDGGEACRKGGKRRGGERRWASRDGVELKDGRGRGRAATFKRLPWRGQCDVERLKRQGGRCPLELADGCRDLRQKLGRVGEAVSKPLWMLSGVARLRGRRSGGLTRTRMPRKVLSEVRAQCYPVPAQSVSHGAREL